ncbi:hypothetical protein GCM10010082_12400 [Kushneria pakistanensis]|uniref:YbaK/aminoacyl-tRNA synthetase-associated domain-containing protein n=1 Tax=Kushneria pakistanensis TaxID=1508770 RepID=A0ABQ3FG81_9GAMM|nr:YbaK/prolyl-tRNA synthetase associated domain-containing protein [Kushneria pakistanensis]GHC22037.1 hypothetical protein GCM10010082_12400 [Kushneria pakistanensis]
MFDQLVQLLKTHDARFRIIEHSAEGRSQDVARIRGTTESQGAKAMLCKSRHDDEFFMLAVLPGNRKLDFRQVADAVGIKKATLASAEDVMTETGCVVGAVPPFVFSSRIRLLADPALVEEHDEIAFNAGRLDRSIVLSSEDYLRIAQPEVRSLCI